VRRHSRPTTVTAESPSSVRRRRIRRRLSGLCLAAVTGTATIAAVLPTTASADPSANDWYRLRMCESGNNYRINTGNNHYGAYQFDLPTWRSVSGTGYPNLASPGEQDARALILYRMRGWQPWQCAPIVGLREDASARSGKIDDIHVPGTPGGSTGGTPGGGGGGAPSGGGPTGGSGGSSGQSGSGSTSRAGVPSMPGPHWFAAGNHSGIITSWQQQMRVRGASLPVTGTLDHATLAVVDRIQAQNGLRQTGLLGPVTWGLAWTGSYHDPAPRSYPAWPGPQYFSIGDHSTTVARWQAQLHLRGSALVGSGDFGSNTLAAVKRIQTLNGLPATGLLGPVTWGLAWTGRF
jgi:resuscitation-promoting factor RpfA